MGRRPIRHILRKLKEGTKIIENATRIYMDIPLPLDREDYEFLKLMNEENISIQGRFIYNNRVIGFFDNGIKSIGGQVYDIPKLPLED